MKPNCDKELCGFDRGFLAIALHLNRMHSLILQNLRDQYYGDLDQAHIASVLMMVTVGGCCRQPKIDHLGVQISVEN
jgi:hypothetical protein